MIIKTPIKQSIKPITLLKLTFSLKKRIDSKIMKTGDEVYIIPIFAIEVVSPAINGKAPQTPQPIAPKKNSLKDSFFNISLFLIISG